MKIINAMKIINEAAQTATKITAGYKRVLNKMNERVPMEPLKRIVDMATIHYWGWSHE